MKRLNLILFMLYAVVESLLATYDFKDNGIGYTIIDSEKKEVKVTYYDSVCISVPENVQFGSNLYSVVDAIYYDSTTCSLKHYDKIDFSKAINMALLRDQTTEFIDIDTLVLPPNIHFFPAVMNINDSSVLADVKTVRPGIHRVFSSGTTIINSGGLSAVNSLISPYLKIKIGKHYGVFSMNSALEEVDLSTHKIYTVSDGAFFYSKFLKKCRLPKTIMVLEPYSFFYCTSLSNLNMLDWRELGEIKEVALYGTQLDSICFGQKVKKIGLDVGYYSECLTKYVVDERNPYFRAIDDVLFDYDAKKLIGYPSAKDGETYIIPQGTEIIGKTAFAGLPNRVQHLEELIFASSVRQLEDDNLEPDDFYAIVKGGIKEGNPLRNYFHPDMNVSLNNMFYLSKIRHILNFENTLIEKIPSYCFRVSLIEELHLPPTLKEIDQLAFSMMPLLHEIDFSRCGKELRTINSSIIANDHNLEVLDFAALNKLEYANNVFGGVEGGNLPGVQFSDKLRTFVFPCNMDTASAKAVFSNRFFVRENKVSTIYCPFEHPWDVMVDVPHYVSNGIGKPVDTIYTHEYTQHCLFYYVDRPNCTLVVPEESVAEFKSAPIWQEFRIRTAVGEVGIGKLHAYPSDPEAGTVLGGGSYPLFNNAYLQAFGKGDNVFDRWSDGNTENPRLYFVAKKSETLVAQFRPKKQYRLTVVANADTMGTVDGAGTYYETDIVRIIAQPYEGYRVESWSFAPYSRSQAYNFSMPSKDTTVVVNFGIDLTSLPLPADTAQQGDTTTLPIDAGLNMNGATTPFSEPDAYVRVYGVGGQLLYVGRVKDIVLPRKTLVVVSIDGKAHKLLVP